MAGNVRKWAENHRAYYEVSLHYVVIEEGHGSRSVSTRRVHNGFDIDICAATNGNGLRSPGPDYQEGCGGLQAIFESSQLPDSSRIEVIPFYGSLYLEARNNFQPQTRVRLRVSHSRGLDQPAGPAEGRALGDIEKRLQDFGIRSGRPAF